MEKGDITSLIFKSIEEKKWSVTDYLLKGYNDVNACNEQGVNMFVLAYQKSCPLDLIEKYFLNETSEITQNWADQVIKEAVVKNDENFLVRFSFNTSNELLTLFEKNMNTDVYFCKKLMVKYPHLDYSTFLTKCTNLEVLKLLIEKYPKLDYYSNNKEGFNLYQIVKEKGYQDIVDYLVSLRLPLEEKKVVDGKEYTIKRDYYDNGLLRYEHNYVNNKLEGLQKQWYDNGQLWYKFNYVNDKQEGVRKGWYDNGQIRYQSFYVNDKQEGLQKEWSKEGVLTESYYKDGIKQEVEQKVKEEIKKQENDKEEEFILIDDDEKKEENKEEDSEKETRQPKVYYGISSNEKLNIVYPGIKEIEKQGIFYYVYKLPKTKSEGYKFANPKTKITIIKKLGKNSQIFIL